MKTRSNYLVLEKGGSVEIGDFGVGGFADHLSFASVHEGTQFYLLSAIDPVIRAQESYLGLQLVVHTTVDNLLGLRIDQRVNSRQIIHSAHPLGSRHHLVLDQSHPVLEIRLEKTYQTMLRQQAFKSCFDIWDAHSSRCECALYLKL